jgi:4-carboxymuconolactone decarboxylase
MTDTSELYARGLARRKKMFGEAEVEKRMAASGDFGAPLQTIINAYVYGDIWDRSGLPDAVRSLVMLAITAATNRPAEFRVHAKGALANGCTAAQVQDVLLLVAMYCGIPAAIETHQIAAEIFGKDGSPSSAGR